MAATPERVLCRKRHSVAIMVARLVCPPAAVAAAPYHTMSTSHPHTPAQYPHRARPGRSAYAIFFQQLLRRCMTNTASHAAWFQELCFTHHACPYPMSSDKEPPAAL
eukprot:240401-Chlamydomonas_euryale.AAC.5